MKYSIITICLNAEDTIERTVTSVLSQTYRNFEYIIVDGGSKDKTLHILSSYQDSIDLIISEPDFGIYDAMNKGIKHASGDVIAFMNAGDTYYSESVFQQVYDLFYSNEYIPDVVYGDTIQYQRDCQDYISAFRKGKFDYIWSGPICHQSIFAKKKLFSDGFSLKYKICSDYYWFLCMVFYRNVNLLYCPQPFSYYLSGGYSAQNIHICQKEHSRIISRFFFISLYHCSVSDILDVCFSQGFIPFIKQIGYIMKLLVLPPSIYQKITCKAMYQSICRLTR